MANQLNLKANLDTKQFQQALLGVKKGLLDAGNAINGFSTASNLASQKAAKSFQIYSGTLKGTASDIMGFTQKVIGYGILLEGLFAGKVLGNMISFEKQFGLMNATLKAKLPDTLNSVKK